ncbi:MAG: asparagine synthase [Bacteroidales bacterium]|nr:asparagine synthase [Bacteroidales bacterium]
MYLLSRKVRDQNIKVVITGEGADEMLAGYDIFKESQIRNFWAREPRSRIRPLLFKKLYPYIPQISQMNTQMLKFVFGYKLEHTTHPLYSHLLRWHNTSSLKMYFSPSLNNAISDYDPLAAVEQALPAGFSRWNSLEKAQWLETSIFLSGYLLSSQGDRMGMANSVEGRYPFLDYRVMEYCASLPASFKLKSLDEKYILKQLFRGRIPESIIKRSKQAFRAPIISTFISQPPDYLQEMMDKKAIQENGIFDYAKVEQLFRKAREGRIISEIDAMAITGIISTQLFSKIFLTKDTRYLPELKLIQPTIYYQ